MNTDDIHTTDYIAEQIFIREFAYRACEVGYNESLAKEAFEAAEAFIKVKRTIRPEAKKDDDDCTGY